MTGAENMAVDEAMLNSAEFGGPFTPALRLYSWSSPVVSIGYLQDASPFDACGVPLVRRITGGRAILHDREITYSVIAPTDLPFFAGGITGAYSVIARCIAEALCYIGVPAVFSSERTSERVVKSPACFYAPSRYEITAGGKKISGSAQRRLKHAFIQHGSILLDIDKNAYRRVFGNEVLERTACIGDFLGAGGVKNAEKAFTVNFLKRFSDVSGVCFTRDALTENEKYLKETLLEKKYSSGSWNLHRQCGAGLPLA